MKTLNFVPQSNAQHQIWNVDINRIVQICRDKEFQISKADAFHAWTEFSDMYSSTWLSLDNDDDEVFRNIIQFCEVINNGNV